MNKHAKSYLLELIKDPESLRFNAHVLEYKRNWAYWTTPFLKHPAIVDMSASIT